MAYPHTWWLSEPKDPYANGTIYLSDGSSTWSWAFTGDPALIIPYEEWLKIPKEREEYVIKPLPFFIPQARWDASLEKYNDKQIHNP